MIGPEVTELINTFSLAMKLEATEADIMSTVFHIQHYQKLFMSQL